MKPPARLACAVVPLFPLAARLRSEPALRDQALIVFEGNGNAAYVVAATRIARRAGVRPGMTLPQSRALLPNLLARGRDREAERAAAEALLDAAGTFSPRVEETDEGVVTLDLDGVPALARAAEKAGESESDLARALVSAIGKAGLPARAGIAGSRLAARVAAGLPGSPTIVPPGEEARFLAPLPLERLGPEMEVLATLSRWGIRSIGDFARLPAADVTSRLGPPGHHLHTLARGVDPRPLVPRVPPPRFVEGIELEWPLVTVEPLLALAEGALERLVRRLEAEALGCARLEITLRLDDSVRDEASTTSAGGLDIRALTLPAPTRDVKTLLELIRLHLGSAPPGAPVTGFALTAHPDRPRRGQLTLFGPVEVSPDRLATALAKLLALLGDGRLGAPQDVDGHRPERFALVPFAPSPPPLTRPPASEGHGLLAVRVLRPPVPLEVLTGAPPPPDAGPGAPPRSLRSLDAALELQGPVRIASGPWYLEEGWWSEAPVTRDYWDVELASGGLYRVFRDRASNDWFVDGVYD